MKWNLNPDTLEYTYTTDGEDPIKGTPQYWHEVKVGDYTYTFLGNRVEDITNSNKSTELNKLESNHTYIDNSLPEETEFERTLREFIELERKNNERQE